MILLTRWDFFLPMGNGTEKLPFIWKGPDEGYLSAWVHYSRRLLLQYLGQDLETGAALLKALELEPDNMDYVHALADYNLK